jgi:hypothetical protein
VPRSRWLALALLAPALAACGGDDEKQAAETVPSTPELTVPGEGEATDETTDESDTTDTTDGTDTTDSGGAAPPATTPSGGAPAPPPPPDSAQNDTPPEDQAPQEFEQFCDQNPGACQ